MGVTALGKPRQINFRISEAEHALLATASFLVDQSPTEFCRAVMAQHLEVLSADPDIQQAAEARARFQARRDGSLHNIDVERRKGAGGV